MVDESEILIEISHKLDQLIALVKLNNLEELERLEKEIKKDKGFSKIIEKADGTLSAVELVKIVKDETKLSKSAIENKIYKLRDKRILIPIKRGRTICYENSGLLD